MSEIKEKKEKVKKPKGPIRFEAIIPIVIIVLLGSLYATFLMDSNIKSLAQFLLTKANGAEVNVGYVNLSFRNGSLDIKNIQFTDKDQPIRNIFAIEHIAFDLSWDALLRAKFVIEDSKLDGIKILSPRKRVGRVIPEEVQPMAKNANSTSSAEAKESFNKNALSELSNISSNLNLDKKMPKLDAPLKSEQMLTSLDKEFKDKQVEWRKQIDSLPNADEFKKLEADAKKLKFNTANPKSFLEDTKKLDAIIKEAKKKLANYDQTSKSIQSDINSLDNKVKSIDGLIQADILDVQKRMKLPSLDAGEFSKDLLGDMLQKKLGKYAKYLDMLEEYMPPKKEGEKDDIPQPPKRGVGLNIKFPVTVSYPSFWLKKLTISSKETEEGFSGNVEGNITNLSSQPKYLKNPAIIYVKGDFKKQEIDSMVLKAEFDYRKDIYSNKMQFYSKGYPVKDYAISKSKDINLSLKKARTHFLLELDIVPDNTKMKMVNRFYDLNYDVNSSNPKNKDRLTNIVNGIDEINIKANANGKDYKSLSWKIYSNLGDAIVNGFKKEVEKEIEQAKQKIKNDVDAKIAKQKEQLEKSVKSFKDSMQAQLDKQKKQLESETQKISKNAKKNTPKIDKKDVKKLLKGIKF